VYGIIGIRVLKINCRTFYTCPSPVQRWRSYPPRRLRDERALREPQVEALEGRVRKFLKLKVIA
jgi:hypothetical protein